MELTKYLIFLPIFLMALTESSGSKSITEIKIKPPSSKLLAKLMGMGKKPKSKPKLHRKSMRLPRMGFIGGNSFHSVMDDQMMAATPRQDFAGLLGGTSRISNVMGGNSFHSMMDDQMMTATPRQDFAGLLGGSARMSSYENSPVYYVRLPPTPYMYTAGLGYVSQPQQSPLTSALRAESFHGNTGVNPFMNLPISFLSNGQPNGAYDFSMPELMSSAFPGKGFLRQEPPIFGRRQFFDDSKFSALDGRFDFNGRPNGLYVLPDNSYFQSNMFK